MRPDAQLRDLLGETQQGRMQLLVVDTLKVDDLCLCVFSRLAITWPRNQPQQLFSLHTRSTSDQCGCGLYPFVRPFRKRGGVLDQLVCLFELRALRHTTHRPQPTTQITSDQHSTRTISENDPLAIFRVALGRRMRMPSMSLVNVTWQPNRLLLASYQQQDRYRRGAQRTCL
jgi:hypothetical protein